MKQIKLNLFNIHKTSTFIMLVTFLTIVTVILTSGVTLAIFGFNDNDNDPGLDFGNIQLGAMDNLTITKNGQALGKVLPGDDIDFKFDVENTGTADMNLRFKINFVDGNYQQREAEPVDTSVIVINQVTAYYYNAQAQPVSVAYVALDFSGTIWYVRRYPLIGNTPEYNSTHGTSNDPPDHITVSYNFEGETMDETYKNVEFDVTLTVETIQYANNGTQRDPILPDYDVAWAG